MYPYFNNPDLMEGYNRWIWSETRLGRTLPEFYRKNVYTYSLSAYVAGVRMFFLILWNFYSHYALGCSPS